jgi:hypothetical protein
MNLICPLCEKTVDAAESLCPRCNTDLSLVSQLMMDVGKLLEKADALRRTGQLAPAVQAYLDVLEVDPANTEARAALGPVLRAVRAPRPAWGSPLSLLTGAVITATAFAAGYWFGR